MKSYQPISNLHVGVDEAVIELVCLFVCVVFNGTSAQKGYWCQESVKIKLVKKE